MNPFRHPVLENWWPALAVVAAVVVGSGLCRRLGAFWGSVALVVGLPAAVGLCLAAVAAWRKRPPF